MDKNYVTGIDLGGTKINSVLSDLKGNIVSQCTIYTNTKYKNITAYEMFKEAVGVHTGVVGLIILVLTEEGIAL
ncbi:putative NBD/HSP70 family sugar kinase [Clostridium tetanomorphum]|uniref:ROK family protein n=1 Tax=Clostridium tetanomorphum TaxID=1553 RepID=A0A923EDA4_CLOTT|nr:ROK family protein [Clostridium tetanomorphum]KAJ52203.1 hypothetical protein CTM_08531 [Clostridium tetanomorphum DSM 665]MBC2399982.1 ROK family protein [Clostridium tetanomorphum]MBP1863806.1 putative NBD/HSP70 family sugar kinase [Clostridium tetanomorphum]NRS86382.1 putative NBD/HSP70 family sugar kinase [Clostridium tetanomorphum]NRZ95588.1 putative NBD/HSP70 family sugar kinase [Clostridium tetanomorphum]